MSQEAYQKLKRLQNEGRIEVEYEINEKGGLNMLPFFLDETMEDQEECYRTFIQSLKEQKAEHLNIDMEETGSFYDALAKFRGKNETDKRETQQ